MKRITIMALSLFLVASTAVFAIDETPSIEENDIVRTEDITIIEDTDVVQSEDITIEDENEYKLNGNKSTKKDSTKEKTSNENNGHYTIHIKTSEKNININDKNGKYAWWDGSGISYDYKAIKKYIRKKLNLSSDTKIKLSKPRVTGVSGNGGYTTSIHFNATITLPEIIPPSEEESDEDGDIEDGDIDSDDEYIEDEDGDGDIEDNPSDDTDENINEDSIIDDDIVQTSPITKSEESVSYIDNQPETGDESAVCVAVIALIITSIAGAVIGLRRKFIKI